MYGCVVCVFYPCLAGICSVYLDFALKIELTELWMLDRRECGALEVAGDVAGGGCLVPGAPEGEISEPAPSSGFNLALDVYKICSPRGILSSVKVKNTLTYRRRSTKRCKFLFCTRSTFNLNRRKIVIQKSWSWLTLLTVFVGDEPEVRLPSSLVAMLFCFSIFDSDLESNSVPAKYNVLPSRTNVYWSN